MRAKRFLRPWTLGLVLLAVAAGGVVLGQSLGDKPSALTVPEAHAQSLGELQTTADVAAKVIPSVVNIFTTRTVQMASNPFMDDPFFRRFFRVPDQPQEREATSLGSGVIMSKDGYILTNNHVVAQAEEIRVTTPDGEDLEAEVVGTDEASDLALIKVDAEDLPAITLGDSDALRVGEVVLAVGNPFGVGETVTMGIVSAKGRGIGLVDYEDFIQTDAAINPGNSGGALVNLRGQLVGINSAILSRSGGSQGIGFAIPTNLATVVMDNLKEHGRVVRGYLGVRLQEVDQNLALGLGLDKDVRGAAVASVEAGSAADRDGLKSGDVITAVDGEKIESVTKLRTLIGHTAPKTKVELTVLRDGKEKKIDVTLGTRPGEEAIAKGETGEGQEPAVLEGLSVRDATPQLARHLNLPVDASGPVIINVEPRTPASHSGLRVGDLILQVDRQDVGDAYDFVDKVEQARKDHPDRPVLLTIQRGGMQVFVALAAR